MAAAAAAVQAQVLQVIEQQGAAIAVLLAAHNAAPAAAAAAAAAGAPAGHARLNVKLPSPEQYEGRSGGALDRWVASINVHIEFHGAAMPPATQVKFAAAHLAGAALAWWQSVPIATRAVTWDLLLADLRTQFQPVDSAQEARVKLLSLRQGKLSVQDYAVEFRQLQIPLVGDSEATRLFAFIQGLRHDLAAKVWAQTVQPTSLTEAIQQATRLDARAAMGLAAHGGSSSSSSRGAADLHNIEDRWAEESPQERIAYLEERLAALGHTSRRDRGYGKPRYSPTDGVSPEQIAERRAKRLCFGCGSAEHIKRDCPKPSAGSSAGGAGSKFNNNKSQGNW